MRSILTTLTLASLALGAPMAAHAAPEQTAAAPTETKKDAPKGPTALETFKASHEAVDKLVDGGADDKALEAAVDSLLDYDWIAKAALGGGKKFDKRCGERCGEFTDLLTKLIRRNYLKRIAAKDNGTVVIIREDTRTRKGKVIAKVDTVVTFTAPDDGRPQTLEVSYIMHEVDGTWQVRDMLTDGLSLAKTWKYDFSELHKEGGIDLVISRLEAKLAEVDELAKN